MAKRSADMLDEEPAHKKKRPVWVNLYLWELAITEQSLMIPEEDPDELITAKLANHIEYMLAHIKALIEYGELIASEWLTLHASILHLSTVGNMLADNLIKNPNLEMSQYLLTLHDEVTNRIYPTVLQHCEESDPVETENELSAILHCEESDPVEAENELSAILPLPIPNLRENLTLYNPFDDSDSDDHFDSDGIKYNDYRDLILSNVHKNKIHKLGNKELPSFLKAHYQKLYDEGLRTPEEVTELISHPSSISSIQSFFNYKTKLMNSRYKFTLDKIIDLCKCSGSSKNIEVILTRTDQFIDYCKLSDEDIVKLGTKSGAYRVLKILANKRYFDILINFGFNNQLITSTFHYNRSPIVLTLTLWCIIDGTFKEKNMTPTKISKIFARKYLKFSDLLEETGKTQELFDDWVEKMNREKAVNDRGHNNSTHPQESQVQDEQLEVFQVEELQFQDFPEEDFQAEELQAQESPYENLQPQDEQTLMLVNTLLYSYPGSNSNSLDEFPRTGLFYDLGKDANIDLNDNEMKDFINSIPTMKSGVKSSS